MCANLPRVSCCFFRKRIISIMYTSSIQILLTRGRFIVRQPPAGFVWQISKTHYFHYVYFVDSDFVNPREVPLLGHKQPHLNSYPNHVSCISPRFVCLCANRTDKDRL